MKCPGTIYKEKHFIWNPGDGGRGVGDGFAVGEARMLDITASSDNPKIFCTL